jgi:oxygen-dependent protoporphyrinogen oxidase
MIAHTKRPIAILGGGLAGLTAAAHLANHRVPFVLFEGGKALAGLCKSDRDEEGFTYDCGVHFITNRLAAAVGIATQCRPMAKYGETVYVRGRHYAYPIGLLSSPRYVGSAMVAKVRGLFSGPPVTAQDHYRNQYGKLLADEIAVPLTEAWSGCDGNQIGAAVGQKFATSLPRMLMLRATAGMTKRVIGIGYSGTVTESSNAWHVYPNRGIAAVCDKLAEGLSDHIRLDSKVEAICVENGEVKSVIARGEETPVSGVISTAPVNVLPNLLRGTDALDGLKAFRYRAMIFVNLKLQGESGLADVVNWFPEKKYPFFRVSDIGMGLPWLVPAGKSQITCDIGAKIGDENWAASDEELTEKCLSTLSEALPNLREKFLGSRVVRVPLAYPIYDIEYEAIRQKFAQGTGIKGLISVGRNGEFAHILMEDVFWRTRWAVSKLIDQVAL